MSKEVAIAAVVTTAPGKFQRFKEAVAAALDWIEKNEPETLQFAVYEEETESGSEHGVRVSLFERYASQEALERHEQSDNYKKFFETVMQEELLVGGPQMLKGKYVCGFGR